MRCDKGALFSARLRRPAVVLVVGFLMLYPAARLKASPIANDDGAIDTALPNLDAILGASLPVAVPATFVAPDGARAGEPPVGAREPAANADEPLGLQPPRLPGIQQRRFRQRAALPADTVPPGSLKAMLRAIASMRRAPPSPRPLALKPEPVILSEADYFDPFAPILESELAGSALRAVIDMKVDDGDFRVFSVLGIGDFVLEMRQDAQSAIFYELSSGWSATLISPRDGSGLLGSYNVVRSPDGPGAGIHERINLVQLVWQWLVEALTSPLGVLATMIVGIILFMWALYKAIAVLQRRTLGSRR